MYFPNDITKSMDGKKWKRKCMRPLEVSEVTHFIVICPFPGCIWHLKTPQCHVIHQSRTEDHKVVIAIQNKASTTSQLISQLNTLPNCSPYLHFHRPAFEDIMQLLDSQPQHIFGRMSLSTLGLILYLTGWCKVHLLLILKLLKLWSIQVCWHPLYTVVLCVNVLSHRLLLFHRLLLI